MAYDRLLLESCEQDIAGYPSMRRQIEKRVRRILEAPYHRSHPLGQGKWEDLRGLRSAPFLGGKYVFLIAICEECLANGFQTVNKCSCGDACKELPLERVVFIAFGRHDLVYGKP